jgi:uncharacterized membrane protein
MKQILQAIKTTLVGGLLIVLPVWLSLLLLLKALSIMGAFVKPVTAHMPESTRHPRIIALLLLLVVCFTIGLLIQTALGRYIKRTIETYLLEKVPGYKVLRGVAEQLADNDETRGFAPALVEIEEALVPAFIVERHDSGQYTVFVPSAPTPAVGSIYIIAPERVHPVHVSLPKAMGCISKWGSGSGALLAAMTPEDLKTIPK